MEKQHKKEQQSEEPKQEKVVPSAEESAETSKETSKKSTKKNFADFLRTKKGKIVAVATGCVLIIAIIFAIPASRYAVAGLVIKKDVQLSVVDKTTSKPISGVQLTIGSQTVRTDGNGKATLFAVPVGNWQVTAKKNYYQDASVTTTVPIIFGQASATLSMVATGRQVPLTVTDKITNQVVGSVEITAGDSSATTDSQGRTIIVLPAGKDVVNATFKVKGYNTTTADITVTEQDDTKNHFTVTPSGKVYFLSKRTGKINVMKSDLDGANAAVVVQATGKESETETTLLASRDWHYLSLKAKRDSDQAKLYFINTDDDKLSVIDEGANTDFAPIGWYNEFFIYRVTRSNVSDWQPKQVSIKSFNAKTNKIVTIEDTAGVGSGVFDWAHESIGQVYILENLLVYGKYWNSYYSASSLVNDKKDVIVTVRPDGSSKQTVKDFAANSAIYIESILYRPAEVGFRISQSGGTTKFYDYEDGKVNDSTTLNESNFFDYNPTYLISPGGTRTLWSESRDGKNILFVGDNSGANGKEVTLDGEYAPYGWFTDDFLLVTKNGSELYIVPRDAPANVKPLKVTDYHKPSYNGTGYGYGYGGL